MRFERLRVADLNLTQYYFIHNFLICNVTTTRNTSIIAERVTISHLKDWTHDVTLREILRAIVLGRVDTYCHITCNIDYVATKLCKQRNLIG